MKPQIRHGIEKVEGICMGHGNLSHSVRQLTCVDRACSKSSFYILLQFSDGLGDQIAPFHDGQFRLMVTC